MRREIKGGVRLEEREVGNGVKGFFLIEEIRGHGSMGVKGGVQFRY